MARITVEDCLKEQNNRFELTLLAAKRARQLVMSGQEPLVPWENDKPTVVALREIADGLITPDVMNEQEKVRQAEASVDAQDMLAQAASSIAQVDAKEMVIEVDAEEITLELDAQPEATEEESTQPEDAETEIKPESPEAQEEE